ncbi:MAG: Cof-type HAD-IIB family hydrolase [Pseudobutyrivibrio sp.]|nr:Cof-type HAD-IIB family hydrolase [Pseudobutyrivibrio sp.]
MSKKVIFFDIDGTLINFGGEFPESAKRGLIEAKENGHRIVICSGRSKCQVEKRLLDFGFDGLVCGAGAYVEYHGQVVYNNCMSEDQIREVLGYMEEIDTVAMLQCTSGIVATSSNMDAMYKNFQRILGDDLPDNINQIFDYKTTDDNLIENAAKYKDAEKVCYYNSSRSLEEVQAKLAGRYDVTAMSFKNEKDGSGEITIAGINKAYGMQKLIDYLGVSREDTVAFGDGPNDFEMIEFAHMGVAMGNASDDLKTLANAITTAVDNDGIYNGLRELKLV